MPRTSAIFAAAIALTVGLTGCGKLGAEATTGQVGSIPNTGTTTTPTPTASEAATLGDISSDLDGASTADSEAESNATAGDRAAATGDDG